MERQLDSQVTQHRREQPKEESRASRTAEMEQGTLECSEAVEVQEGANASRGKHEERAMQERAMQGREDGQRQADQDSREQSLEQALRERESELREKERQVAAWSERYHALEAHMFAAPGSEQGTAAAISQKHSAANGYAVHTSSSSRNT